LNCGVRWLADECVAAALVAQLRAIGHDVSYIAELAPSQSDAAVIALAQRGTRVLLTEDKDFGELIFRHGRAVPGLVLIRIDPDRASLISRRLEAAIVRFGDRLFGRYTVIEESRFRSRPLRE
jgi:predicted nuclease of predicted toxin-antitoxin system